jgi:hypothetical protein
VAQHLFGGGSTGKHGTRAPGGTGSGAGAAVAPARTPEIAREIGSVAERGQRRAGVIG